MNGVEFDREDTRRARVLYDYEAENESELTVCCEEVGANASSLFLFALPSYFFLSSCLLFLHTHTHTHSPPSLSAGDQSDSSPW